MSEKETFDRLRRPSLHQMTVLVTNYYKEHPGAGPDDCEPILLANHWTLDEYRTTYNDRVAQLLRGLDIIND